MKQRLFALAGAIALGWASTSDAGVVSLSDFDFELKDGGGSLGTTTGTAFSPGRDVDTVLSGASVEVDWITETSVDVSFFGGVDGSAGAEYILSGLNFFDGLTAKTIADVTFNRGASDIDDFIGDTSIGQPPLSAFQEPVLSFTDTSFTARFSFFDPVLVADGPRLRYDLTLAGNAPVVPVPASLALMLTGLGSLWVARRRTAR